MSAYADKIALEVLEADERAGRRGVEHPALEWHKAVALARAVLKEQSPEDRPKIDVESRDFYELCQQYRFSQEWYKQPRLNTMECFAAIKEYIKTGKLPWPSYETGSEPQQGK